MKDVRDWITVKTMYKKGIPIRQITRDLKMSWNTVKRLIKYKEEPKYKKRKYTTTIDKYLYQIQIWYLNPEYNFIGTRIYRELKKFGYKGSISPIYRYLDTLKDKKNNISLKTTKRIETPLGDQEQFVKGNRFNSMTELNKAAGIFIEEANNSLHSTTLRITNEFFVEEIPHLSPVRM
ncbi:hypothetical protein SAMN02745163_02737 [Clostridium cavendishii DSM 21758]|uniref:HTH IS21-type domain-containing protein n=1 Tax=Clostridium cavendishii DSM 21758 TaxID=1121302 RepID=A0A1M6MS47_9CLOT|nr:hypothetical protein [Clostridium cavendishii]SHJ86103.1 hypothetical protein SAMN02745163_02737 [Clostridium cavendishii DSM 21758]